jgi:hypothetical protein
MAKSEAISAILPESAVKGLKDSKEIVSRQDQRDAVDLDQFLATKRDAPIGWKRGKSEGGKARNFWQSLDGKFEAFQRGAERVKDVIGKSQDIAQVARDGIQWILNKDGKQVGTAENWTDLQQQYYVNGGRVTFPDQGMKRPDLDLVPTEPEPLVFDRDRFPDGRPRFPEGLRFPPRDQDDFRPFLDPGNPNLRVGRDSKGRFELPEDATPDLDQDAPSGKLTPDLLGEGYGFSKDGENSWIQSESGANGESYVVSKGADGKWTVSELSGRGPDNFKDRDLEQFDSPEEAFDYANNQGASPREFDQDWVDELQRDQAGPDLDQNIPASSDTIDRGMLSPEMAEKYSKELDDMDGAIAGNDFRKIGSLLERAALDLNLPDEVYDALYSAKEVRATRSQIVENAIAGASKEELESLADDPKYAGWSDRLQDALAQDVDLDQDAPTLSEKQSEPATGKQYAFLQEFLDEKDLDPATEQALKDALENKNLNKAQASSLIALGRTAGFKDGVDPSKPSTRMIDSLQGYLATKDLAPSEIKEVLDSLQKDGSRDNVDALLNKLRRKKDKPVELNQGISSLTKYSEGSYEWEDTYNNVGVNKTKSGWEVEYTNPDLNERGGQTWHNQSFNSEAEALEFAENLIKQNQDDAGYGRAADDLAGIGDFFRGADLDQDVKGTTADKATDKQWDFLQSLLDNKKITDPNLEAAVRSALDERNLTKGEVGAFIGALRNLEDKPNARREPTAKQIASIKRALLERDLTPEERKSMQDKLAAGLSFDEASEMLNDLKKRDITLDGMSNLLNELKSEQDVDTLRYLLDKPEYSEYRADIKDTLRQLALDTEDPNLQEFIDAREDVDLDQDVFEKPSAGEINQKGLDIIDEIESKGPIGDETSEEFQERIQGYRDALDSFVAAVRTGSSDLIESSDIRLDRNTSSSEIDGLLDQLEGLAVEARTRRMASDVDLDQDASSSSMRNRIAQKLAEEIDALDSIAINGKELLSYLEEFDRTDFPYTAAEMAAEVYNMSNYVKDSSLRDRLRDLSERLDQEVMDRFGIAEAARVIGEDLPLDLDEVADDVDAERQMYFETDVDVLSEKLEENGSYGDNRSGGAEGRVSENEDGTFTARVDYDRDGEEQTFDDYEDAIAWAANRIASYNEDVIPSTYEEYGLGDLAKRAAEARTDEELEDIAASVDAIAADLEENRGDPRLAQRLKTYGERIREMIAARDARNQSEAESQPLNSETLDEMSVDPDLNPAGYAQYAANDIKRQMEANLENTPIGRTPWTDDGNYTSSDGRVTIAVESDVEGRKVVLVIDDEFEWFLDDRSPDLATKQAAKLIEEHFSKKD